MGIAATSMMPVAQLMTLASPIISTVLRRTKRRNSATSFGPADVSNKRTRRELSAPVHFTSAAKLTATTTTHIDATQQRTTAVLAPAAPPTNIAPPTKTGLHPTTQAKSKVAAHTPITAHLQDHDAEHGTVDGEEEEEEEDAKNEDMEILAIHGETDTAYYGEWAYPYLWMETREWVSKDDVKAAELIRAWQKSRSYQVISDQQTTMWKMKEMIQETAHKYKIEWEGIDPNTGQPWPQTWEPKLNANDSAIDDWLETRPDASDPRRSKKRNKQGL